MPLRLPRLASALALLAVPALAQNAWQFDDTEPFAKRKAESAPPVKPEAKGDTAAPKPKDKAPPPLSPNRIVGRILWVDTTRNLCVVALDPIPADRTARLVARTPDCRARAVLTPVPLRKSGATAAFRTIHGVATKDLELILPDDATLNAACAALPRVPAEDRPKP